MRNGIAVAGTLLADSVKIVDSYPVQGNLCNIKSIKKSVGGLVSNTGIGLAALDKKLKVTAVACAGGDADGDYVLGVLQGYGIDTSRITVLKDTPTSFTDVMTVESTGARTFFHARGANAVFSPEYIDFDSLSCDIFHLGYALLLDCFDAPDRAYGTVMAKTLAAAQKRGFKTSIDVVSENGDRFARIVTPSLKYCDYAVLNEIESGMVAGVAARDKLGLIIPENIERICRDFFKKGVREYVVVHCPEAGFMMDADYKFTAVPSLHLPPDYIKGTVGAGDAFAAGILYSLYNGFPAERALKTASCCAAANLSESDSVSGMRSFEETMKLDKLYKRQII